MRTCRRCGTAKPLGEFPPYRAKGVVGRRHTCRDCWNVKWSPIVAGHNKRYYHENKGGYRDRLKARTNRQHHADRASHHRRNKEYEARHPLRAAAKRDVMLAVRAGRLLRKPCEVCADTKSQAHHDDYLKPLEVIWLCAVHHGERHRLLNRRLPANQWPEEWPADLRVREFPA